MSALDEEYAKTGEVPTAWLNAYKKWSAKEKNAAPFLDWALAASFTKFTLLDMKKAGDKPFMSLVGLRLYLGLMVGELRTKASEVEEELGELLARPTKEFADQTEKLLEYAKKCVMPERYFRDEILLNKGLKLLPAPEEPLLKNLCEVYKFKEWPVFRPFLTEDPIVYFAS